MDREIVMPGQLVLAEDILHAQRHAMVADGALATLVAGQGPFVDGFACTPTVPVSMSVLVGPGAVLIGAAVDAASFGTLPADGSATVKVGRVGTTTSFPLTVPATPGQSIAYLVECSFVEEDVEPSVRSYYNAVDPTQPYSGPDNSGAPQMTRRAQRAQVRIRAGAPAATGTALPPPVDAGWVGLYAITVGYGATGVGMPDIQRLPGAPYLTKIPDLAPKVSPAFTGAPTAPTPAASDTSTRLATTEFVRAVAQAVAATAFGTGDIKATLQPAAPAGWVLMNDGTIGRAGSGATTRAAEDCEALFHLIWSVIPDAYAPVPGGRGISSSADWASGRVIALPRALGRALAAAGTGSGLGGNGIGQFLGAEAHVMTEAEMPSHGHGAWTAGAGGHGHGAWTDAQGAHAHNGWTDAQGNHRHGVSGQGGEGGGINHDWRPGNTNNYVLQGGGTDVFLSSHAGNHSHAVGTDVQGGHAHGVGVQPVGDHVHPVGVSASGGSQALSLMQPTLYVNFLIRL